MATPLPLFTEPSSEAILTHIAAGIMLQYRYPALHYTATSVNTRH